jgi:hypothetical protein
MSEAELHNIASRPHGAKRAAAERDELRFPLPVGYVYDPEELHPRALGVLSNPWSGGRACVRPLRLPPNGQGRHDHHHVTGLPRAQWPC